MSKPSANWPSEPYKGLIYYGPQDRPLFSGRDEDVDVCISYLLDPVTRILLLHGQTGCGKSSFLRAGLIPGLEERAFGYFFLRDVDNLPLFIRCGSDPLGRIAEHLFHFASRPVTVQSVNGRKVHDLSAACLGYRDLKAYVEACRKPGELMKSLHVISESLPYTLAIVIDQAEEVITLSEGKSDHRRQFFRFVREFSTTSFPLKFVLALRKDYSGQFIENSFRDGSIRLPPIGSGAGTANAKGDAADTSVKWDMKIFLLSELGRDEVLHAIELPTSKSVPEGRETSAFNEYQFTFASKVTELIVRDLFDATSSTAVLPVMQIVCRDLYNQVAGPKHDRPKPWVIDHDLYVRGGGIVGPVDRHVSTSLRGSFGKFIGDLEAEERRWREILYRLVRRESDGTVHTRIVSLAELRAIADEIRPSAKLDDVVAHLIRPEILLLRSVTILDADEPDEGKRFSLGHDFIAMVLQQWKLREQEAKANEEKVKRAWRFGALTALTAVAVIGVAVALVHTAERAKQSMRHQVLVNTATVKQRDEPLLGMQTAAHATLLAADMNSYEFKQREVKSDRLLAGIIAGLPKKVSFASSMAASPTPVTTGTSTPLPKSIGFANVEETQIEIAADTIRKPPGGKHSLERLPDLGARSIQTAPVVSELKPGTVLLLRASITLPAAAGERVEASYQLFVFKRDGSMLGPFDAEYFRKMSETLKEPSATSESLLDNPGKLVRSETTRLALSGGIVVLSRSTPSGEEGKGELQLESFMFDEQGSAEIPFTRTLKLEKLAIDNRAGAVYGLPSHLFLDGYLVVPEAKVEGQNASSATLPSLVKYDLRARRAKREEIKGIDGVMACSMGQSCEWRLFPARPNESLLVFGFLKGSERSGQRSFEQILQPDLKSFEQFFVIDVVAGKGLAVDTATVSAARELCVRTSSEQASTYAMVPKPSDTKLFISGGIDSLLVGFHTRNSVDVIRIEKEAGMTVANCLGTLFFVGNDLSEWAATPDGKTLLGAGEKWGAQWSIGESTAVKSSRLMNEVDMRVLADKLRTLACESGLKDYTISPDEWKAKTNLDDPPILMCVAPRAQGYRKLRASPAFPGITTIQ